MMSNGIEYHEAYSYSCRTIAECYYGNSFHYLFLLKMTINLIYWFCIVVGWTDKQTMYIILLKHVVKFGINMNILSFI